MITGAAGPSPIKTERGETSSAAAAAGGRISTQDDIVAIAAIDYGNSEDHAKIDSFPPGYRFCPRDSELVIYYLQKKVLGEPLPMNKIMEVNLYKYDPQTLAVYEKYGEGEWYFFTPRDKKYPNGTRPNRAAGNGYWKATGADKVIKDESTDSEVVIGLRKALVYYMGKPPKGEKTDWIMHEFRLKSADDSPPRAPRTDMRIYVGLQLDDYVLCRIYNKTQKPKNRLIPYFSGKKKQAEAEADDQDTLPLSPAAAIIDDQDPLPLALPSPPSPASAIATPTYHHHHETLDHYMAPPSFHVHQYHHHQQLWQPVNNCGQCYHDLPAVPAIVDYTSYNYGGSSEASFTNNNSMFNAEWSNKDDLGQVDLSHLFY
ncbi:NAC transcription factor ONAC010 [Linum perenne]